MIPKRCNMGPISEVHVAMGPKGRHMGTVGNRDLWKLYEGHKPCQGAIRSQYEKMWAKGDFGAH